jgi:peptidoglycan/LPS O-acetylase OafA/YrhL
VRRVFSTLDGLRGVAALAVLEFHWAVPSGLIKRDATVLAVDLFFVLSGFVLAHAYGAKIAGGMGALAFMRARLARLFPMAALAVAVAAAAALIGGDAAPGHAAASLALTAAFIPTPPALSSTPWLFPYNLPAWSLFFELVANLLFVLMGRHLTTWRVGALVIASAVWLALQSTLNGGPEWSTFASGFPRVFFGFFLGVLIYRLQGRLPAPKLPPWSLVAALAVLLYGIDGRSYQAACVFLLLPLLVHLAANTEPAGRLRQAFALLGGASYPLYVLHAPTRALMLAAASEVLGRPITHYGPAIGVAAMAGLTIASILLDRWADGPARRLLLRERAA